MAETRDDGGQAFPRGAVTFVDPYDPGLRDHAVQATTGMSLRDYFAGQALTRTQEDDLDNEPDDIEALASWAYEIADAMLKERAKP